MNQICRLVICLGLGLNCQAQSVSSNGNASIAAPARTQEQLQLPADKTEIVNKGSPLRPATALLPATQSGEWSRAFAYSEHPTAAANLFAYQQTGDGLGGKARRLPATPQSEGELKNSIDVPVGRGSSRAASPQPDGKLNISIGNSLSTIDAKQAAAFRRMDALWKAAPVRETGFQHAVHSVFWTDPAVVTSPAGFSGSQLWQRTFDPRTSTWTTPRIAGQ